MKFTRVKLENIRCYKSTDLSLNQGVTVIHGPNGSGKTTLLEACFFALYGSRALDETLDQFVMTGAEEGSVELWFTHSGEKYHVRRRVRITGDRATTAECILETPSDTINGARDVRKKISQLLRMDSESFVNCAYVRQGEINKLIHASPETRQDIIDELLQLGDLEKYRDRAGDARLAVSDFLERVQGELSGIQEQIEEKEEKNLHQRLNKLETDLNEITDDINRIEEQKATAEDTRDRAAETIEEYQEKRQELEELRSDIDQLTEKIQNTEQQRTTLQSDLQKLREKKTALQNKRDTLQNDLSEAVSADPIEQIIKSKRSEKEELRNSIESLRRDIQQLENEADTATDQVENFRDEISSIQNKIDTIGEEIESDRQTLQNRKEKLNTLIERREMLSDQLTTGPVEPSELDSHYTELEEKKEQLQEELRSLVADKQTIEDKIDQAKELRRAGRCPKCGQPTDESPHVDAIDDQQQKHQSIIQSIENKRETIEQINEQLEEVSQLKETKTELETLDDRISTAEQLISEREDSIEEKQQRIESLQTDIEDAESEIENKQETVETNRQQATAKREEIATLNQELTALQSELQTTEELKEITSRLERIQEQYEAKKEQRSLLKEQNDERKETVSRLKRQRKELKTEYNTDRLEEAKKDRDRAEKYIEQANDELESLTEQRDKLQNKIGGVRAELNELESLRERAEQLHKRETALENVHQEVSDLESMYGNLRATLRQQNVSTLQQLLNETFDLIYRNDAYDEIELSDEYELTVYQKDGTPLDPDQLSGGERALFNLSLRCAIYRLLAEGIDGAAPMPPLILDEPTVFLDSGHVKQLVELINTMYELGVEQIIVVSHDDHLLDAADNRLTVMKDPTTNRSSVSKQRANPL